MGASQVEKSTVNTTEYGATHTRGSSVPSSVSVAEMVEVTVSSPSPLDAQTEAVMQAAVAQEFSSPAGFSEAEWKAKLARVAEGLESGVCESCES
jgi:hypothetical protein